MVFMTTQQGQQPLETRLGNSGMHVIHIPGREFEQYAGRIPVMGATVIATRIRNGWMDRLAFGQYTYSAVIQSVYHNDIEDADTSGQNVPSGDAEGVFKMFETVYATQRKPKLD